jgi:uncharacterized membrane protein YqjE
MQATEPHTTGVDEARSPAGLVREAVAQMTHLITAEITLAKREIKDSISAGVHALVFGVAAIIALVGCVVMGIVTLVAAFSPHWVAALIIAVVFLILAAAAGFAALRSVKAMTPLRQTVETLQEDVEWAKRQMTHDAK